MVKQFLKSLLGPEFSETLSRGLDTLCYYPKYVTGRGRANAPKRLTVEVTFACNARCRMCPLYGEHTDCDPKARLVDRSGELSAAEMIDLVDQCAKLGIEVITFTGGEPFLRKDMCDIIGHAHGKGIRTHVISNGSVMTERIAHDVVAAGLDSMDVSIDGPEEVHNWIRRVPDMYATIMRTLGRIRTEKTKQGRKRPMIIINCTVSSANQQHLHELVDVAAEYETALSINPMYFTDEAQEEKTSQLFEMGDTKPESQHVLDSLRLVDVDVLAREIERVDELAARKGVPLTLNLRGAEHIRNRYYRSGYAEDNKCLYPWYATRMTPSGDVYPCSINSMFGNIREKSLEEIWNDRKYVRFRQSLKRVGIFPKCSKCCVLNRKNVISRLLPRW